MDYSKPPRCIDYKFDQDPRQSAFDRCMKDNVELAYDKFKAGIPIFISTAARRGPFEYQHTFAFAEQSRIARARQNKATSRSVPSTNRRFERSSSGVIRPSRRLQEVQETLEEEDDDVSPHEDGVPSASTPSNGACSSPPRKARRHKAVLAAPEAVANERSSPPRRCSSDVSNDGGELEQPDEIQTPDDEQAADHVEISLRTQPLQAQHPASSFSKSSYLPTPTKRHGDPAEPEGIEGNSPAATDVGQRSPTGYLTPDDSTEDVPELVIEDTFAVPAASDEMSIDEQNADAEPHALHNAPDSAADEHDELATRQHLIANVHLPEARDQPFIPLAFDFPPSTFTAVNASAVPQSEVVRQAIVPHQQKVKAQSVVKAKVVNRATSAIATTEAVDDRRCHQCTRGPFKTWRRTVDKANWLCETCYRNGLKERKKAAVIAEQAEEEDDEGPEVLNEVPKPAQAAHRACASKSKAKEAIKASRPVLSQRIESQGVAADDKPENGKTTSFLQSITTAKRGIWGKKTVKFGQSPHHMVMQRVFSSEGVLDASNLQPKVYELLGEARFTSHVERRLDLGSLLTPHKSVNKTTDVDVVAPAPPLAPADVVTKVKKRKVKTFDTPDSHRPKKSRKKEKEAVARQISPSDKIVDVVPQPMDFEAPDVAQTADIEQDEVLEAGQIDPGGENSMIESETMRGPKKMKTSSSSPDLDTRSSKKPKSQSSRKVSGNGARRSTSRSIQESPIVSTQAIMNNIRVSDMFDSSIPSPDVSGVGQAVAPVNAQPETPAAVYHRASSQEFIHPETARSAEVSESDEPVATQAIFENYQFMSDDESPESNRASSKSHQSRGSAFDRRQSSPLAERTTHNDMMTMPPPSTLPSGRRRSALKQKSGAKPFDNSVVSPFATPNFLPTSSAGGISTMPPQRRPSVPLTPGLTRPGGPFGHIMDMDSQRSMSQDPDFSIEGAADSTMALLQGSQGNWEL